MQDVKIPYIFYYIKLKTINVFMGQTLHSQDKCVILVKANLFGKNVRRCDDLIMTSEIYHWSFCICLLVHKFLY